MARPMSCAGMIKAMMSITPCVHRGKRGRIVTILRFCAHNDSVGGHTGGLTVTDRYYTTSRAFLEALAEAGGQYVFANLGSDHPGLIETLARAKAEGREHQLPELVVCP